MSTMSIYWFENGHSIEVNVTRINKLLIYDTPIRFDNMDHFLF